MVAGTYTGSISLSGKDLLIHGAGATLNGSAGVRTVQVSDGAHLRILGLTIVNPSIDGNFGIAISCDTSSSAAPTATVELDGVSVDSGYMTFFAQPCTATIVKSHFHCRTSTAQNMLFLPTSNLSIDRSIIDGGDGIWCEGANSVARITNTVIKNQTGPDGAFGGSNVFGQGAGSVYVSFSTVIDSLVKCGSTPPRCAGGTDVGSCIDNSIVFNSSSSPPSDTMTGGCRLDYSIVSPQSTFLGGTSNQLAANPMLKDIAAGDYHLSSSSPAVDAADPSATNNVDFDGIARPQDAHSDIGAFEYKP